MMHLDDCQSCQEEALGADPTLLFRRLPEFKADGDEVQAMRRAVAGLRRSEPLARRSRSVSSSWLQAAAIGAVLLGSVLLRGANVPSEVGLLAEQGLLTEHSLFAEAPAVDTVVSEATLVGDDVEVTSVSDLPLVEMVDPAYGPLIEVVDQEISLVVVMPENRDV